MLFAMNCGLFRAAVCCNEKAPELCVVRKQRIEGELLSVRLEGTSPHAMTAVSGDGVKPGGQGVRVFEFVEVLQRPEEDILRGIFRILMMFAHLHAEGKHCVL